jgi:penicillin-binding protein 1C
MHDAAADPRLFRRSAVACAGALACLALVWLRQGAPAVPPFDAVRAQWRSSEAWLLDRHGRELQRHRVDMGGRRLQWAALDAISPALVEVVVAGEDRRFFRHGGVDPRAVAAAVRDAWRDERARGASTITMQVAALLAPDLRRGGSRRTFGQKLRQMRAAHALEASWSKQEILEAYLNLVTFRGELQGIAVTAQTLFGKAPAGINGIDAAVLAALLPAPNAPPAEVAGRACRRAGRAPDTDACAAITARAQWALRRGTQSAQALAMGAPDLAPHLAVRLLDRPGLRLRTTLDARLQRLARDALGARLRGLTDRNVRDGAALVVDNASGEVLAYVASAGSGSRAAQVDGVQARRQAGSTLKPFLYAHALERRYLTAASILADTPVNLETASGLYIPQNYDRDFRGRVSVRTALASSLNVPAVRTLALVGVEAFRDRLHAAGYRGISESGDFYGFSLALGSAEVSLWEQVTAYRMLARGGLGGPLRLTPAARMPSPGPARSIDPRAAFIVADILADRGARAATFGLDSTLDTRYWSAVKTGTSKDMRDNWCIGFSTRFTVGVWVGNFEGDAMHDVSGVTGAAPVWLDLMNALHADRFPDPPVAPAGVVRVAVRYAPVVEPPRREWFLAGTETELVELIDPARVVASIALPANGAVLALDPDIPAANQQVVFDARGDRRGVEFRLNGAHLAPALAPVPWRPVPGDHTLTLADGQGRTLDSIRFTVRGLR